MATDGVQYLLPEGTTPGAAVDLLAARLGVAADPATASERTYYDTFDGRLHAVELVLVHDGERLTLAGRASSAERAGAALAERPDRLLAADLPGPVRDALADVVEMRALAPTVTVRARAQPMRVLDDAEKTVVRLTAEAAALPGGAALRPRLHVQGVRGYDAELRRVREALEHDVGLVAAADPGYDEAVVAAGGRPGGVPSKPDVTVAAGDRADAAAAAVLEQLWTVVEANLPGTLADVDTEFLHDLRVAVRRTRSVQRQLKAVFGDDLEHWRGEFRWLQQVTGPTRDLDVHLLEFDHLAGLLPSESAQDLEPLRGLLAERRAAEQAAMVRALRSARTRRILTGWPEAIRALGDSPDPIGALAGARIAKVHHRMVRMGSAIDADSPAEALHDLRKKGKELRYLLELFGSAFPREVTKPMVKTLKALQDTLGRFQDREVQADLLRHVRDDVAARTGGPAALMAMGALVEELGNEQTGARDEFAERFADFASKRQRGIVKETFR